MKGEAAKQPLKIQKSYWYLDRTGHRQRKADMLSEQRYAIILELLEKKHSITVTELSEILDISESTARRDINALDRAGRLTKVFGGAISPNNVFSSLEPTVAQKTEVFRDEKIRIAKYAASLIKQDDFIFLDAGTTTGYMLDFIRDGNATFVTNAVAHAQKLASAGKRVLLIGGELKSSTEAIVGTNAVLALRDYHFTKGFFGTNGISKAAGLTTPDMNEALVKKTAMRQCMETFVVSDHSKFNMVSSVTFSSLFDAMILTDDRPEEYRDIQDILTC